MRRRPGQSMGAYFANWRTYQGSLIEKFRLAARNSWLRVVHRDNCCGNPGQPGC